MTSKPPCLVGNAGSGWPLRQAAAGWTVVLNLPGAGMGFSHGGIARDTSRKTEERPAASQSNLHPTAPREIHLLLVPSRRSPRATPILLLKHRLGDDKIKAAVLGPSVWTVFPIDHAVGNRIGFALALHALTLAGNVMRFKKVSHSPCSTFGKLRVLIVRALRVGVSLNLDLAICRTREQLGHGSQAALRFSGQISAVECEQDITRDTKDQVIPRCANLDVAVARKLVAGVI